MESLRRVGYSVGEEGGTIWYNSNPGRFEEENTVRVNWNKKGRRTYKEKRASKGLKVYLQRKKQNMF
ncbi:hypothetical protein MTR_4g068930 [Medicago truncatula]|uniref:Uncharacterized protein n=1 Tax=Medicago truncatula TaxID=3880 RepID=A0A072UX20_MEDTR|nr:hypothetical protein MTR_4g068930 [Medicago truncatula]